MIRMRTNKNPSSTCCECGKERAKVIEMFDIKIGKHLVTVCDECNDILFDKTLKASCRKNGKIKDKREMSIIRQRKKG